MIVEDSPLLTLHGKTFSRVGRCSPPDCASESHSVVSDSLSPHGQCSPWNSPGQNTGVGIPLFPSPEGLPSPGIKPGSPTLQADSSPAEPPGKPKSTGVGSLSLLQGIFPTQESNWGLLHFRQILYQLSHRGTVVTSKWQMTISKCDEPGKDL